ncbi:oligosaccharyl transferase complex subunit OST4 [Capronia coronata CBS 617.96]|uniref:Dolichyl-diphosphooligosaccharide--protein glycosyltransferase subunit OST2 n=1 Tax=Capronia coronata CBS 617.96 TaxID=1182541 RepID=W9ZI01_9EURO|nr:oligosaccharyl transferase complex subunit OST4 [Capronia coronata CBS 617.96]EXJ94124.1 oligosaccharyl transferase complex subunit OST4 [Capronia coronata CBS 617.96]
MARKPASHSAASKTNTPVAAAKPPPAARTVSGAISTPPAVAGKPIPQSTLSPRSSAQEIIVHVWNRYLQDTPSRTMLLDVFMSFLVAVGAVQFLYCVVAGNYPFNAFLSGFSAAVGQFVLTASLRMQTSERPPSGASAAAKKSTSKTVDGVTGEIVEDGKVSSERAFADYVFGSLILHGFCVNFIN